MEVIAQEDYEKGTGQKISHVLRSFGGYNDTLPTSAEMEEKGSKTVRTYSLLSCSLSLSSMRFTRSPRTSRPLSSSPGFRAGRAGGKGDTERLGVPCF